MGILFLSFVSAIFKTKTSLEIARRGVSFARRGVSFLRFLLISLLFIQGYSFLFFVSANFLKPALNLQEEVCRLQEECRSWGIFLFSLWSDINTESR